MAQFVAQFGWTPADYYAMTVDERTAIMSEMDRRAKQQKH